MNGKRLKVVSVFGTRPEAIKLAPVIHELQRRGIEQLVCVSGQQREMLDQMLQIFEIRPDFDLNIMRHGQTLEDITSKTLTGLHALLVAHEPNLVLVQGDTTTAMVGALAALYQQIPVGHVEAGLRTDNLYNPFPEEANRRIITQLASLHFAPTPLARKNLLQAGIDEAQITLTGNTVIDSLIWVDRRVLPIEDQNLAALIGGNQRFVLLTSHRRENLGGGMDGIFSALAELAEHYPSLSFIFPVHLNPAIRQHALRHVENIPNIILTAPFSYSDMVSALKHCYLVLTDSGGLQEEAPAFGKPVLVLRTTTERPEGVDAGTAKLVGVDARDIVEAASQLLDSQTAYDAMANAVNPYGKGDSAVQIVDAIEKSYRSL